MRFSRYVLVLALLLPEPQVIAVRCACRILMLAACAAIWHVAFGLSAAWADELKRQPGAVAVRDPLAVEPAQRGMLTFRILKVANMPSARVQSDNHCQSVDLVHFAGGCSCIAEAT